MSDEKNGFPPLRAQGSYVYSVACSSSTYVDSGIQLLSSTNV